jgi:hypothetical protein
MTIPIIIKTAVTSKITVSELSKDNLSPIYEGILDKSCHRVDLTPELSTILGTRYLEEQPYNKIKVYKDFRISLEPLDEELLFESDIYWRKINQNPKSTEFNHDEDAQWFMIPKDLIAEGEYDATVVLDNDDVPRHLVCNV